MFDLTQIHRRRMVRFAGSLWMIVYDVDTVMPPENAHPTAAERLANIEYYCLAVPCNTHGDVTMPAPTSLIRFTEAALVNPEPRA